VDKKQLLIRKNKNPYRDKRIKCLCGCHDIGMKKCEMCVRIHVRHLSKKQKQKWEEQRIKSRPYGILINADTKTKSGIKQNIKISNWRINFNKKIIKETIKERTEKIKIEQKYIKRLERLI